MGWADSLFSPPKSADAIGLWSGSAGVPSERWYPYPSAGWGDSLFCLSNPQMLVDFGQALLGCHLRDGILTHPWDGRIYGGRKHENACLQSSSFQDSIQKGPIFIKLSGVVLDYTYYIENGHPEG